MESANRPNREDDRSSATDWTRLWQGRWRVNRNIWFIRNRDKLTFLQAWLVLVLQTYQLHSFELANKKRFLRSAFCCCFLMAVNSTDGESGVLRSRQYYIQSDWSSTGSCGSSQTAVARWLALLTDNQLIDNGVEAFPCSSRSRICFTPNSYSYVFQLSTKFATYIGTVVVPWDQVIHVVQRRLYI